MILKIMSVLHQSSRRNRRDHRCLEWCNRYGQANSMVIVSLRAELVTILDCVLLTLSSHNQPWQP